MGESIRRQGRKTLGDRGGEHKETGEEDARRQGRRTPEDKGGVL